MPTCVIMTVRLYLTGRKGEGPLDTKRCALQVGPFWNITSSVVGAKQNLILSARGPATINVPYNLTVTGPGIQDDVYTWEWNTTDTTTSSSGVQTVGYNPNINISATLKEHGLLVFGRPCEQACEPHVFVIITHCRSSSMPALRPGKHVLPAIFARRACACKPLCKSHTFCI